MVQKALAYKATMYRLKPMFSYQLTLLSNNQVLMSYLNGIYLESCFSWLGGGTQKTLKERRKQTEKKFLKNEKKEKRKMQGKSNNNNKHLLPFM